MRQKDPILQLADGFARTNLQKQSEKLYWTVFNSIPENWIGDSGTAFGLYYGPFFQSNRFAEAEKVQLKLVHVRDYQCSSLGGDTNCRLILAELYELEGKFKEAIEQYQYVIDANKWRAQSGIVPASANEVDESKKRIAILEAGLARQGKISAR